MTVGARASGKSLKPEEVCRIVGMARIIILIVHVIGAGKIFRRGPSIFGVFY